MKRLYVILVLFMLLFPHIHASEPEKLVALTFDDGPSGRFTRALLQGLQERDVQATFLLCGYRMEQYPTLTRQIMDAGHEIGLHGYSHKAMNRMTQRQIATELEKTLALLPEGCPVAFLRPPGGQTSAATHDAAKAKGLSLLSWSVDPRDWATRDAAAVEAQVLYQVRDGDVILLHDMSDSSVTAALAIVDKLQAQGFRFVTVSQLAEAKGVAMQPGQLYCRFDG